MMHPHKLLLSASLQLFADGHPAMAHDLRQLAVKWTPQSERYLIHELSIADDNERDYDHLSPIQDL